MAGCAVLALSMIFRLRSFLYLCVCVVGIYMYLGVSYVLVGLGGEFAILAAPWVLFFLLASALYFSSRKTSGAKAPAADRS